jgi:biotin operon repressor
MSSIRAIVFGAMSETSGRLLKLLSLLQARRDWPGEELARRLEVSGRTIRRDVERLRGLGYPVDALTGPAGGYRLHAGTAMPPLLLDDDEAVAIAVGLRTATGRRSPASRRRRSRALVKLEQVLPSHLRRRVEALQSATATLGATGPTVDPEVLALLAGRLPRPRARAVRLQRPRRRHGRRQVEPHSLVHLGRRWYLLAFDCDREAWRTFRVIASSGRPRAGCASRRGTCPAATPPPTWRPTSQAPPTATRLASRCTRPRPRCPAVSTAGAPSSRWTNAAASAHERRLARLAGDPHGMLGIDFEVHEPPELVERFRVLAGRFGRATGAAD